jgi:hypothetical protein
MSKLAVDSKVRRCDLVQLQVDDVCARGRIRDRATDIQKKTGRPVQFEITEQTRAERSGIGFPRSAAETAATCSRAASGRGRTCRHGNMPGSLIGGSKAPGWIAPPTAHIRCGERRRPRFIRKFRASARRGRSGSTASRQGWHADNSAQRAGGTRHAMPRPPPNCAASR